MIYLVDVTIYIALGSFSAFAMYMIPKVFFGFYPLFVNNSVLFKTKKTGKNRENYSRYIASFDD